LTSLSLIFKEEGIKANYVSSVFDLYFFEIKLIIELFKAVLFDIFYDLARIIPLEYG